MAQSQLEKYKNGIVKVETYLYGVPMYFATGFFVSKEGHLITSNDIINHIYTPGIQAVFKMQNGQVVDNFELAGCSDQRRINICYLKLPVKPEFYFSKYRSTVNKHEPVWLLGHEFNRNFTAIPAIHNFKYKSTVNLIKVSKTQRIEEKKFIEQVSITSPIRATFSGAPIITENGELVAMATYQNKANSDALFGEGLSATEVNKYRQRKWKLMHWRDYIKSYKDYKNSEAKSLENNLINPVLELVKKDKYEFETNQTIIRVELEKYTYAFSYLPEFKKERCVEKKEKGAIQFICQDLFDNSTLILEFTNVGKDFDLLDLDGKYKEDKKPLQVVSARLNNKEFKKQIYNLSDKQKKWLYSMPQALSCNLAKKDNEFILLRSASVCTNYVFNYNNPSGILYEVMVKRPGQSFITTASIITKDSLMSKYHLKLPWALLKMAKVFDAKKLKSLAEKEKEENGRQPASD